MLSARLQQDLRSLCNPNPRGLGRDSGAALLGCPLPSRRPNPEPIVMWQCWPKGSQHHPVCFPQNPASLMP